MSFEASLAAEEPTALMEFVSTTDQAFAESVTEIQHARAKLEVRSPCGRSMRGPLTTLK